MEFISCKEYAEEQKELLRDIVSQFNDKPQLVVIQVDDNPASNSYINNKKKLCKEVGIQFTHLHISSEKHSQKYLEDCIKKFGEDDSVSGIIIQLPIPDKYNVDELLQCIPPNKDVDGFRKDSKFTPCTPDGIRNWLKHNNYNFVGKEAVVVGRSEIVGKPLTNILIDEGATVTCCNSHSDVMLHTECADIVFSAIGKPKYFDHTWFDKNAIEVVVDVGINRDENGKLCGDVDREDVEKHCPYTYVTPVPNGVGKLTVITLIEHTVQAYIYNNLLKNFTSVDEIINIACTVFEHEVQNEIKHCLEDGE